MQVTIGNTSTNRQTYRQTWLPACQSICLFACQSVLQVYCHRLCFRERSNIISLFFFGFPPFSHFFHIQNSCRDHCMIFHIPFLRNSAMQYCNQYFFDIHKEGILRSLVHRIFRYICILGNDFLQHSKDFSAKQCCLDIDNIVFKQHSVIQVMQTWFFKTKIIFFT